MKILFLVPYPLNESPSQRFRFEQYFKILRASGYSFQVQSFLESDSWLYFYQKGSHLRKLKALLKGFGKRCAALFSIHHFDIVFIHREAAPIGPPIFEWIIARILRRKIVYDFDDAIWLTDRKNESPFFQILKWRSKVQSICRWSYKVSCGNEFLCSYAKQYNSAVVLNPTTIDTENLHNPGLYAPEPKDNYVIVGWTGSHSTLKYLESIEPVLIETEKRITNIKFMIIADRKPALRLNSLVFKPWSLENEIQDLAQFDIGIMPLPDNLWSKGKCGFKALQYMAMGIATIASPVGVNIKIIDHGVNGFLCSSQDEWITSLEQLARDASKRRRLGAHGREKIVHHYSVVSNSANFLSLFQL